MYNDAKRVLIESLKALHQFDQNSVDIKAQNVEYLLLMSRVFLEEDTHNNNHLSMGENVDAKQALMEAKNVQADVIDRCKEISTDRLEKERELAAKISFQMGEYFEKRENDLDQAQACYLDSMNRKEDNPEAILAAAKLNMRKGDLAQCKVFCNRMLKLDHSNEEASFMLANLMMANSKPDEAIECLKNLLDKKPNNFNALSSLISLLKLAGKLQDAPGYVERAEKAAGRSSDAGLSFVKGTYYRYIGEPQNALKEFNLARQDGSYIQESLINMAEIYLNPDNELIYSTQNENFSTSPENLRSAELLIQELRNRGFYNERILVMESYVLMQSRTKDKLEKAISRLAELLQKNKDYVPALVAYSIAKLCSKKANDAKTYLKAFETRAYQPEFENDFEKAWLLQADMLIAGQKFKDAEKFLEKCLFYNKSNVKAEEYMGVIREKEQDFSKAASHYESAWRQSFKKNPAIGYRLALNYMKARRFVDCIDVCKEVLKKYPDYPIDKEVLQKAQQSIRS